MSWFGEIFSFKDSYANRKKNARKNLYQDALPFVRRAVIKRGLDDLYALNDKKTGGLSGQSEGFFDKVDKVNDTVDTVNSFTSGVMDTANKSRAWRVGKEAADANKNLKNLSKAGDVFGIASGIGSGYESGRELYEAGKDGTKKDVAKALLHIGESLGDLTVSIASTAYDFGGKEVATWVPGLGAGLGAVRTLESAVELAKSGKQLYDARSMLEDTAKGAKAFGFDLADKQGTANKLFADYVKAQQAMGPATFNGGPSADANGGAYVSKQGTLSKQMNEANETILHTQATRERNAGANSRAYDTLAEMQAMAGGENAAENRDELRDELLATSKKKERTLTGRDGREKAGTSTPSTTGGKPAATGGTPATTGTAPAATGGTPATTGTAPAVAVKAAEDALAGFEALSEKQTALKAASSVKAKETTAAAFDVVSNGLSTAASICDAAGAGVVAGAVLAAVSLGVQVVGKITGYFQGRAITKDIIRRDTERRAIDTKAMLDANGGSEADKAKRYGESFKMEDLKKMQMERSQSTNSTGTAKGNSSSVSGGAANSTTPKKSAEEQGQGRFAQQRFVLDNLDDVVTDIMDETYRNLLATDEKYTNQVDQDKNGDYLHLTKEVGEKASHGGKNWSAFKRMVLYEMGVPSGFRADIANIVAMRQSVLFKGIAEQEQSAIEATNYFTPDPKQNIGHLKTTPYDAKNEEAAAGLKSTLSEKIPTVRMLEKLGAKKHEDKVDTVSNMEGRKKEEAPAGGYHYYKRKEVPGVEDIAPAFGCKTGNFKNLYKRTRANPFAGFVEDEKAADEAYANDYKELGGESGADISKDESKVNFRQRQMVKHLMRKEAMTYTGKQNLEDITEMQSAPAAKQGKGTGQKKGSSPP